MLTLSQHIELFRNFATAHSQIKSFAFGRPEVIAETDHGNADERLKYPILFMELDPVGLDGNNLRNSYTVYVLDRLDKSLTNREQVLENTMLIGLDLFSYLKNSPPNWLNVLELSTTMEDLEFTRADALAGWTFPITLKQPFKYDTCNIPYTSVPPAVNTTCPQVTIYESNGITVHELVSAGGYFVLPSSGCASIIIENSDQSYEQIITCDQSPYELTDTTVNIYLDGVLQDTQTFPTLEPITTINIDWD